MAEATEKKEKTVRIRIPKTKTDTGDVFVSVNERTWLIKRGEYVDVPECVAEVLQRKEEAEAEMMSFDEENVKG